MIFSVCRITPVSEGESLLLEIRISNGENEQKIKGEVATQLFTEMGYPLASDGDIVIDREKYMELERAITLTSAIKKGIGLLSFSQNTKKALKTKLTSRGFTKEISSDAVDYLESVGYIDEYSQAETLVCDLAEKKLFGISRIRNELYKKGFCREAIEKALDCGIDFDAVCAERIEKTIGTDAFLERDSRGKAIAALSRYGFSIDNIKEALTSLAEE